MGFLKNVLGFEKFGLKDIGRQLKKDPERILLGAFDPASSKMWSKVTGKNYEPVLDQMGGQSSGAYKRASEAGIDVSDGRKMHNVAKAIAAFYAGSYALSAAGGAGAAGGGAAGGGAGGASSGAINPALIESSVGSSGYGVSSASPGFSGGSLGSAGGGTSFNQGMQNMPGGSQQRGRPQEPEVDLAPSGSIEDELANIGRLNQEFARSSKSSKVGLSSVGSAMQKGISGQDPIDTNGVHVASIQELKRQIDDVRKQIAKKKGGR